VVRFAGILSLACLLLALAGFGGAHEGDSDSANSNESPSSSLLSRTVPSDTPNPNFARDLLHSAIDPLHDGDERRRFLRAAGVDSEMNEQEFDIDQARAGGFARTFDRWSTLLRFDRNQGGTIDWLEVSKYREAIRTLVLQRFDSDGNGRLTGKERLDAIAFVTSHPLTVERNDPADDYRRYVEVLRMGNSLQRNEAHLRLMQQALARATEMGLSRNQIDQIEEAVQTASQNLEALQQQLDENDLDGDGEISPEERRRARQARHDAALAEHLTRYDANTNGRIDREEYEEYRRDRDRALIRDFDCNGNGVLNDSEREEWEKSESFRFWNRFDEADVDRNGILDPDEQRTMLELWRNEIYGDQAHKWRLIE
jgi:Ca2+-binding EF-hand superfamily protein